MYDVTVNEIIYYFIIFRCKCQKSRKYIFFKNIFLIILQGNTSKEKCVWLKECKIVRLTWSQFQSCTLVAPHVLWYSSRGGSIRMTSNLQLSSFKLYDSRSVFRYIGGVAVSAIRSSFNLISSRSFGYSSNLSARPTSLIKFCGRWPVSIKCWQ